ncbi:hypothetical protein BG006_010338 [Podila minutissima]|uniref:Ankyrin repeat protein n=1 Tax=Podila minutissima TaxID=64525 RepID=A0A9P5SQ81_9FUNG|nr:hypothetical protein BG006_010338 [Podila minutissima]
MISIQEAAADNNIELVKKYLSEGQDVNQKDSFGYTALHQAASYDCIELAKYLIQEKHANVNIEDEEGDTPLFACETTEMIDLLLENGANLHHKNQEGRNAADTAIEEEWEACVTHYKKLGLEPTDEPFSGGEDDEDKYDNEDMSHLDEEAEHALGDTEFQDKVNAIMEATQADGINRDAELTEVVTKMLQSTALNRREDLSEQLKAMVDKASLESKEAK